MKKAVNHNVLDEHKCMFDGMRYQFSTTCAVYSLIPKPRTKISIDAIWEIHVKSCLELYMYFLGSLLKFGGGEAGVFGGITLLYLTSKHTYICGSPRQELSILWCISRTSSHNSCYNPVFSPQLKILYETLISLRPFMAGPRLIMLKTSYTTCQQFLEIKLLCYD